MVGLTLISRPLLYVLGAATNSSKGSKFVSRFLGNQSEEESTRKVLQRGHNIVVAPLLILSLYKPTLIFSFRASLSARQRYPV